jgi:hypothetical protein
MEMRGGLMNDILIVFANTIFRMAKLFIAKQALKNSVRIETCLPAPTQRLMGG